MSILNSDQIEWISIIGDKATLNSLGSFDFGH